jgi:hypothetical protein
VHAAPEIAVLHASSLTLRIARSLHAQAALQARATLSTLLLMATRKGASAMIVLHARDACVPRVRFSCRDLFRPDNVSRCMLYIPRTRRLYFDQRRVFSCQCVCSGPLAVQRCDVTLLYIRATHYTRRPAQLSRRARVAAVPPQQVASKERSLVFLLLRRVPRCSVPLTDVTTTYYTCARHTPPAAKCPRA